jgi:hypothetical protein
MILRRLILPILILGFTLQAHANTTLQLVDVGPGYSDGSYYVYPYNFSINGSPTTVSLLCDDFRDDIYFGETWSANLYTFSDILAGNGQMFPDGGLVAAGNRRGAYMDAAWLYQQLLSGLTPGNAVSINHTIWGLFENTPFNGDADVASWYSAANAATAGLTDSQAENLYSNVGFYTPIPGSQPAGAGRPQEFLTDPPSQTVPEPAAIVLLGIGLTTTGLIKRRQGA